MSKKTKTALEILQASLLLGVLGDLLLRQTPWGINAFIWFTLVVLGIVAVNRFSSWRWESHTITLHAAVIFFAFTYVLRDSTALNVFSFLAIVAIFAAQVLAAFDLKAKAAGVIHYMFAAFWSGLSVAFGPFILLLDDINWASMPKRGFAKYAIPVGKGLAIALPIVLVFGAFFMAADAAFERLVQNTFRFDPETLISHALLTAALTWIVAGYLRATALDAFFVTTGVETGKKKTPETPKKQVPSVTIHISDELENEPKNVESAPKPVAKKLDWRKIDNSVLPDVFTLGAIETVIILGLVNLLFLSFVIVQIPYLFGGMELVQTTPDFKLAEYARRGFGELTLVAALVLPILLITHWLLRRDSSFNEKLFRILAGIQIILLFVIMASAAQRLLLLTGNLGYGLTDDRLYSIMFIILLGMIFVWFGMTVLRGARDQFAWGALWCALFMLGTLHVLNPDDFIVRTNVRLMQEGREFDAKYNARLSDDAIPALIESLHLMRQEDRCVVINELARRKTDLDEGSDLRTWNYSRWNARTLLEAESESINPDSCKEPSKESDGKVYWGRGPSW